MKILIDGLGARVGAGITYLKYILPSLANLGDQHRIAVLLSPHYQDSLINDLPAGIEWISVDLPARPLYRRFWYQQTAIPQLLKELDFDIFFASVEAAYFRIPVAFVMVSHNLYLYTKATAQPSQQWTMLLYRLVRQPIVFPTLRKTDRMVFVSATLLNQAVQRVRLDTNKLRVIYYGVSPIFSHPAPQFNAPPYSHKFPYFLSVSTVYPHKNYETLIRAFAQFSKADSLTQLLIAGRLLDQATYHNLRQIVIEEQLEERVHFLGEVTHEELPGLYQNAVAFISPSRLEAFGLPLAEAMASGTPVIASDIPAFHEICQRAALYFDPDDVGMLVDRMHTIQDNVNLRTELVQQGQKRANDFSWDTTARKLIIIFEEIVS